MNKVLVAYFSATGTTARVAHKLAEACSGVLFAIKPQQPYTAGDLNWHDQQSRSSQEMKDDSTRPPISDKVANFAQYGTIFLGFPIWWYQAPRIIETFLGQYDFTGKTIIPFATSGGSGLGDTESILKKICPQAHWEHGRRLDAMISTHALAEWINKLSA